ncbi:RING-H2 finger protein ATL40-like [Bidens hawaiensis]|uniref:RING-H2 finger protein ATL40-like n=1 Tax=Bidens hawaiensis TaxID=980011 RepID=UPI00404A3C5E
MPDPLESSSGSQTAISNNSFFTPLVISIIGITATALAVIFYHLLLVRYCIRRHAARMAALQTFTGEETLTGVDDKTLSTIPIITYKKPNPELVSDQTECAVCLADLEDGENVRLLPECKHLFHVGCIDEWFDGHTSCPVCRVPVVALAPPEPPDNEINCPVCRVGGTVADDRTSVGSDDRTEVDNIGGLTSGPRIMLRHCHSLVLPGEIKGKLTGMELKRSFSMGHSACVVIDISIDYIDQDYTYYWPFRDFSIRQFQRVSTKGHTKVKQSVSRVCVGQRQRQRHGSGILPY